MCAKNYQQRFKALVFVEIEKKQGFLNAKQEKYCAQKLGISSSCMRSIDYNNYSKGTRCSSNELKGVRLSYCIFVCSG